MKRWLLPALLLLLTLISLLTLRSVVPELATQQALFFVIGFSAFFLISKVKFRQFQNLAWPIYIIVTLLLVTSYLYGFFSGKTGRWIPILGLYNLQPSQLAIPATALVLSSIKGSLNRVVNLLKYLAVIALPAVLILIEPDLGTTLVYLISTGIIIFLSDISWKKIISLISIAIIGAIFSWFFVLKPYQKQRITSFADSSQDTRGSSYNARQSLIAAGSGQLFGRGLGQGVQSHLKFLPERQTDFIFASLAEEFGFVGSMTVVLIYLFLIISILQIGLKSGSKAEYYFCISLVTMFTFQVGINIGMNIGLVPITGLTLPLLSYGGSSLLSLMAMLAIVQSISNNLKPQKSLHLS
ncbi:MAG: rod shape-determining protein RodA [Candidatus Pacebacteria bacterium]|jgi:rod shape determining protein RodA|nr:rod shape-determining protein RodA [Candidatus Paceibacterota bacterium]MBT3512066.1 rod shape-determining protein RodA [Candidatus Paceibacterota bacterium]MBT4004819.1 rod shape-determining protein RodA [Candidatus Paceibacterota bacterium]MBT4358474.1 rod shape-determining protein RodA [Candidatus Paceibacterota bacterium]MBT4681258.1 rod shape-determining protein RodA [Candidatus Paceibacterota bacterium]